MTAGCGGGGGAMGGYGGRGVGGGGRRQGVGDLCHTGIHLSGRLSDQSVKVVEELRVSNSLSKDCDFAV